MYNTFLFTTKKKKKEVYTKHRKFLNDTQKAVTSHCCPVGRQVVHGNFSVSS